MKKLNEIQRTVGLSILYGALIALLPGAFLWFRGTLSQAILLGYAVYGLISIGKLYGKCVSSLMHPRKSWEDPVDPWREDPEERTALFLSMTILMFFVGIAVTETFFIWIF